MSNRRNSDRRKKQNKNIEITGLAPVPEENKTAQVQTKAPAHFIGTRESGLAFLLCFVLSIILSLCVSGLAKSESFGLINLAYIILHLVLFVVVIAAIAVFCKVDPIKEFNLKKTAHYTTYIIWSVAIVALLFSFTYLSTVFEFGLTNWGYTTSGTSGLIASNFWQLLLVLFSTALLPAVLEELVFRGIILKGSMQYGKIAALVLSTFCFALFHGSIEQVIYQLVLGGVLGLAYITTGDLKLSMLMHFLNNATILVYAFIMQGDTVITGVTAWQIVLAIGLAIVGLALVFGAWWLVKKLKKETSPLTVEKEEKRNNVYIIIALTFVALYWLTNTLYGFGIDLSKIFVKG